VHHTCGLANTGEVFCWGLNEFGQLGTGTMDDSSVPVLVGGGVSWVAVSAGYAHTCGVAADGSGFCWGRNHYGQLGVGDTVSAGNQLSPFPMAGGRTWASFDLGAYFSCGTEAATDAAYCWGYNGSWQLGVDLPSTGCVDENGLSSQCIASPTAVTGTVAFASISAHTQHTCGLGTDGFAYCWGSGSEGQLGTGDKGEGIYTFEPLRVAGQP
jgi:alpha-tubulin suppressor-like RCC1 family protein